MCRWMSSRGPRRGMILAESSSLAQTAGSSSRKMPHIVRNGVMEERLDSAVYARWRIGVRRAGFFHAGDRVGVAVSGGRDSVLLLEFMRTLGRELGLGL